MDWSREEQQQLLKTVADNVDDKTSFTVQRKKVKWDEISQSFNGKSAKDCETMFDLLTEKVRKYRLVSEILQEAGEKANKGLTEQFVKKMFPDFPKKPANAVAIFTKKHKKEFEGIPFTERSKACAEKWNALSEAKKSKYREKHKKKMEQYQQELNEFYQKHPNASYLKGSQKSAMKCPTLPSPLNIFMEKIKSSHPNVTPLALKNLCSQKYKKMKDKKKLKYILEARNRLEEYNTECEAYKAQRPDAVLKPGVLKLTLLEKQLLDRHDGKPDEPPQGLYRYFATNKYKLRDVNSSIAARSKEISSAYQALNTLDRKKLEAEYKEVVCDYVTKFKAYYDPLPAEKKEAESRAITSLRFFENVLRERKSAKRRTSESEKAPPTKKVKKNVEPVSRPVEENEESSTQASSEEDEEKSSLSVRLFQATRSGSQPAQTSSSEEDLQPSGVVAKSPRKAANTTVKEEPLSSDKEMQSSEKGKPLAKKQRKSPKKLSKVDGPQNSRSSDSIPSQIETPTKTLQNLDNGADDDDDFDDSLLSYRSPKVAKDAVVATPVSKIPKGKLQMKAGKESQKPSQSQKGEKSQAVSEEKVEDALISFFSPLKTTGTSAESSGAEGSPKKKKKGKHRSSSAF